MQPFVAESVPHRRRAFVFVAALAVVGALALIPHHSRAKQRHHPKCRCNHTSYVVVVR
jgi:hypothetical protein